MQQTALPITEIRDKIAASIISNKRLILQAPTGSGKSTQVPGFFLENLPAHGRILVLQPRRIAARMLAHRVAFERGVPLGSEIGFQTRFESALCDDTRILFITEGILPRRMLSDPSLRDISAVIFDEFHERSLTTDLGLALVRALQERERPDLRIAVMSATIDTAPLAAYLKEADVVQSSGRMHPVDVRHVPVQRETAPWDAALNAVRKLLSDKACGDILVFMPGSYEIRKTVEALKNGRLPEPCDVLPLYGDLPFEQQTRAMEGAVRRKIIVATNIAETSLTIPGVRHVVDSGLARVNRYDPLRGFNTLYVEPISRASADQRAGRAGREAPGTAVRLWSEYDHSSRAPHIQPEIGRVDLSEALLNLKMLGVDDPGSFGWFEPPSESALNAAATLLRDIGALTPTGALTPEGRMMSGLPAHPRLSRLLLECSRKGIPRMGAFAAAVLSERNLMSGKPDITGHENISRNRSDFEALHELITRAESSGFDDRICLRLALNRGAARQVLKTQAYYLNILRRLHEHTRDDTNDPAALSKALLCAYPDRLARFRDNGTLQYVMRGGKSGDLDRNSAARGAQLIVATDIRETRNRDKSLKTIFSLACSIEEEWLLEMFSESFRTEKSLEWNSERRCVVQSTRTYCLETLIEELRTEDVDLSLSGPVLARAISENNLKLDGFGEDETALLARAAWVASVFPEKNLPDIGNDIEKKVLSALCEGESRYSAVKAKPTLPVILSMLGEHAQFVERMAPTHLQLPNGRRMPIEYAPMQQPRGRSRIQDFYGMNKSPTVAGGRVTLLLEILAPNNRPVQVTDDLAGFWERHYPELKKTLSRRYPRHEWR